MIRRLLEEIAEAEKLTIYAPGFPGFYCTIFDKEPDLDDLFNDSSKVDDDLADYCLAHCEENTEEYEESVGRTYVDFMIGELKKVLPSFDAEYVGIDSPNATTGYNYTNDDIDINIKLAEFLPELKAYIKENEKAFSDYIAKRFKPRSGYIPFYSDNIEEWDFDSLEEGAITAILEFILINEGAIDKEEDYAGIIAATLDTTNPTYDVDMNDLTKEFKFDVEPETLDDLEYYVKDGDTYKWIKDAPGQQKLPLEQ